MASIARVVVPGAWHHATQRGNHRQMVFFGDADRAFYLGLPRHYTARHAVRIVALPTDWKGLANALGRTHTDYARWMSGTAGRPCAMWN